MKRNHPIHLIIYAALLLVGMMVGIVMLGLVGLMMVRLLTSMLRVTTAQIQVAGAQSTSRMGVSGIPLEFREIGYDTLLKSNGIADSDLEAISATSITFRAMRGVGMTCDLSNWPNEIKLRLPIFGLREPALSDSFRTWASQSTFDGVRGVPARARRARRARGGRVTHTAS